MKLSAGHWWKRRKRKPDERMTAMTEYKIGNAIVRMHGKPDQANLEAATARFLNKVVQQRRKQEKERSGKDERKACV